MTQLTYDCDPASVRLNEALKAAVEEHERLTSHTYWSRWYCDLPDCDGNPHGAWHWCSHPEGKHDDHVPSCKHARSKQCPPVRDEWLTWLIRTGRGFGKMLALDTPIPTPGGWLKMGEVRIGDSVFDEQGQPCRVVDTFDGVPGQAYRLVFSDGTHIDACSEHQWVTWDGSDRKRLNRSGATQFPEDWAVRPPITTEGIAQTLRQGRRGDLSHCIPVCHSIHLPRQVLPIDPYVLGVWLGDGDSRGAAMTVGAEDAVEMREHLMVSGCPTRLSGVDKRTGAHRYAMSPSEADRDWVTGRWGSPWGLHNTLDLLGLLRNKHVPATYLRSATEQRLALLQGLMDTDGSSRRHSVEFCSTNRRLAEAVVELARSLGQKPVCKESRAMLRGRDCGPRWRVTWRPTLDVFRLSRKRRSVVPLGAQALRSRHRMVVAVQPIPSVPMRCLTVDSPHAMYLAGEGMIPTHNTRAGAEWVIDRVRRQGARRVALVGRSAGDIREVMIEGASGIMACSTEEFRPDYEPSKRRLTWPNGAIATTYSAEEASLLRGPEHDTAWCDELSSWQDAVKGDRLDTAWNNLMLGLRSQVTPPRCLVTTTPKPNLLTIEICRKANTVIVEGSTYENLDNLSPEFRQQVLDSYEGTRVARQELHGELIEDVEGALWTLDQIDRNRILADALVSDIYERIQPTRICIAVDPAATYGEESDEHGIVVAAKGSDGHIYVLADLSGRMPVTAWPEVVATAYETWQCDRVIGEVNNGGDYISATMRAAGFRGGYEEVRATRGKQLRAEPVAQFSEQDRVHHVGSGFKKLEDQLTSWVPGSTAKSPDRLDAYVYACAWLEPRLAEGWESIYKPFTPEERADLERVGRRGWAAAYAPAVAPGLPVTAPSSTPRRGGYFAPGAGPPPDVAPAPPAALQGPLEADLERVGDAFMLRGAGAVGSGRTAAEAVRDLARQLQVPVGAIRY